MSPMSAGRPAVRRRPLATCCDARHNGALRLPADDEKAPCQATQQPSSHERYAAESDPGFAHAAG